MRTPLLKDPWAYFALFCFSNSLLSYSALSLESKLWIALFGVALPFALGLHSISRVEPASLGWMGKKSLPGWVWWIPLLLGATLRLQGLTTLSAWPVPDDGLFPYFAMREIQEGDWRFFYHHSQAPPLYLWLSGVFFKLFSFSLFSLWLLPALLSIAALALGIWAARRWMGDLPAWFFSLYLCFNFWALYAGRFNGPFLLILPLEAIAWGLLAPPPPASSARAGILRDVLMGLCLGLGFWTFTPWVGVALPVAFLYWRQRLSWDRAPFPRSWAFGIPVVLCLGVFAFFALREGYGDHIQASFGFGEGNALAAQAVNSFSYWTIPFWGRASVNYYGPVWGGLLGSVLGALVFLGWISILRGRTPWRAWAYFSVLGFGVFPAMLTKDCEMLRTLQWIPFLMAAAAAGTLELRARLRSSWRGPLLALLLAAAFLPEAYHLFGAYKRIWGKPNAHWSNLKSESFHRAFGFLEKEAKEKGNGVVLCDLLPAGVDQSLVIACHSFDVAHNPRLDFEGARWAGILANVQYEPFLRQRFPEGKWVDLSEGSTGAAAGGVLGIIPIQDGNREIFRRFFEASRSLGQVQSMVMHHRWMSPHTDILEELDRVYPAFRDDPFLETCYWEKVFYHSSADHLGREALQAVTQAVKLGYPASHLYFNQGILLERAGFRDRARVSFEAARRSMPRLEKR